MLQGGLASDRFRDLLLALGHQDDIGDIYVSADGPGVGLEVVNGLLRSSLKTFGFEGCRGDLSDIAPLAHCPNLERLVLEDCKDVADFRPLSGLPQLKELRVELMGQQELSFEGLDTLASNSLQHLSVKNYGGEMYMLSVSSLATSCPNLTKLNLDGCVNVVGVDALCAALPALQVLGDYEEAEEDDEEDDDEEMGEEEEEE